MQALTFPPTIDSTILSTFRSCPRKFFWQYIEHWKPRTESIHLVAGGAFASGVEAARKSYFVEGRPPSESEAAGLKALIHAYGDFEAPEGSAKGLDRVCGALEFYFQAYPLGQDGATPIRFGKDKTGIELSYATPLDFNHPISGDPLLYTGRSDMVAEFAGGIYVYDEKTTSQLGASWSRQWELRSQFTGYCFGCQSYGIEATGVIVRGVSILKTKYDTLQVITYRPQWEIDRWLDQVYHDLNRMKQCHDIGYWDYNLDHSCCEYGGCPFVQCCKSPTPEIWLDMYFERKVWDPMDRRVTGVEEYEQKWQQCLQTV